MTSSLRGVLGELGFCGTAEESSVPLRIISSQGKAPAVFGITVWSSAKAEGSNCSARRYILD